MKIGLPTRSLLRPSAFSMVAVMLSLTAWLFPTFGVLRKGFDHPSLLDINAVVVLTCWYLLVFASFYLGQKLAVLCKLERAGSRFHLLSLDSDVLYITFSVIATLSMVQFVYAIFQNMTLAQALIAISIGQMNALIIPIFEHYHVGLISMRYIVMYPASIALYRMICRKKYSLFNIFNVLLLALSAFLSFRLILIASIVTTTYLVTFGQNKTQLRVGRIALVVGSIFLALSLLNVSRNAAYYQARHLSFGLAGLNEIIAYLGTPFQAAIGSVDVIDNLVAQGSGDPAHLTEPYRQYVDVAINYNTNSAFVALHQKMGYWCWPYLVVLCSSMGALFTFLQAFGRTYFLLPCGAILYASGELWRIDLFETGTFSVWLIVGLGVPGLVFLAGSVGSFIRKTYMQTDSLAARAYKGVAE